MLILFHQKKINMRTNYSILFYLKKPRNYVSGPKPIYMRITVDGIPSEISTSRTCDPARWNSKANRVTGTKEEAKLLNNYLETMGHKIADIHLQYLKEGLEVTAENLKRRFLGMDIKKRFLIESLTIITEKC